MKKNRNIRIRQWAANQINSNIIKPYDYKLEINAIKILD